MQFFIFIFFLYIIFYLFYFFFSSRRRHTRLTCDWSSDVCSSDLQAFIALQDYVSAEPEFKQMLALHPSAPGVHYMYGVFLLKEHPSLAIDEFRREIEISPNHAVARIQLALEFLRTADYDQSMKYAKEAVALAPQNFIAHVAYGRLWLALGKTDRAVQELRTAVKLAPGSPHAHLALSRALYKAGQKQEAAREQARFDRLKALSDETDQ